MYGCNFAISSQSIFRSNKKGQKYEIYKSNIFWLESHFVRTCGIILMRTQETNLSDIVQTLETNIMWLESPLLTCGIMLSLALCVLKGNFATSSPSILTHPSTVSNILNRDMTREDFPDPVRPTTAICWPGSTSKLTFFHSIYIRIFSPWCLLSTLLNWFKLVCGAFGQSNMHRKLNFWTDQPGRNWT